MVNLISNIKHLSIYFIINLSIRQYLILNTWVILESRSVANTQVRKASRNTKILRKALGVKVPLNGYIVCICTGLLQYFSFCHMAASFCLWIQFVVLSMMWLSLCVFNILFMYLSIRIPFLFVSNFSPFHVHKVLWISGKYSFRSAHFVLFRESSSFPEITEWIRLHSKVEIRLLNIMSLVGRSDYFFSIRLVFVFFPCAHNQNKLCNSMMYIFFKQSTSRPWFLELLVLWKSFFYCLTVRYNNVSTFYSCTWNLILDIFSTN